MAVPAAIDCNPRSPAFYQDPAATYAQWHAQHPVFFWKHYGMWCFTRFADVNALLRDSRFGRQITHRVSRSDLGWPPRAAALVDFDRVEEHSLLNLEPPRHTQMRALVNKAFISREIESLRPTVESLVNDTIDAFADDGHVELIRQFAMPVPARVIARMVGVPDEAVPDLLSWSHAMVKVYTRLQSAEDDRNANRAAAEFSQFLTSLIRDKRRRPQDDLLSRLVTVRQAGQALNDAEIISTVVLLLNAGHEASVHLMGNAVSTLLTSPDVVNGVRVESVPISDVAQEALRFCSPLHVFTRYALEDMEVAPGVHVQQGDEIGLILGAANRDPLRFDNPNTFEPMRTSPAHVSLGAGIHYCVGAVLARMELEIGLSALFKRLPGLALDGPLVVRDSYHFHGLEALNLRW